MLAVINNGAAPAAASLAAEVQPADVVSGRKSSSSSASLSTSSSLISKLRVALSPKSKRPAADGDIRKQQQQQQQPLARVLSCGSSGSGSSSGGGSRRSRNTEVMERVFRYFDENGDGKISPAELQSCMRRSLGEELSAAAAAAVVASSDSDGDGLLGFEDFLRLLAEDDKAAGISAATEEEEESCSLREAFRVYEMEGQGCITPKSLKRALCRLGDPRTTRECAAMIRGFDLNGDGVICFDEFRAMMMI